ncbi:MAG: FAD-binding protein [Planctomycetota bacterium]
MTAAGDIEAQLAGHVHIERDAALDTWYRVGGRADLLARPETAEQLARCVEVGTAQDQVRIIGDGANLLVADAGVGGLAVSLQQGDFVRTRIDAKTGRVRVGAGAALPRLINTCVAQGLAGIEGIAGIPATVGGALRMNAGGSFGAIADVVRTVTVIDRDGTQRTLDRDAIGFGYRTSDLAGRVVVEAELELTPGDAVALKARLKEVMAYKTGSQPMSARSAGCAFRNPTLAEDLQFDGERIGDAGERGVEGLYLLVDECRDHRAAVAHVDATALIAETTRGIDSSRRPAMFTRPFSNI